MADARHCEVSAEKPGEGAERNHPSAVEDDALALMRLMDWVKMPAHAVKGIIGADEIRRRRGYPDQMNVA